MQYRRSGTTMDDVSQFFPQNMLGRLARLGELSDDSGGFDWQGMISSAPAMLKDLYIAHQTGEAQSKLLEINLERARRGQTPIDSAAYAPQVNVGVAPQTMKTGAVIALGGIGLVAALMLLGGRRR